MGIWICLAVFLVGTVGGLAFAALRGFRLWRQVKRTKGAIAPEAERIARVADEIALQLDRASASSARLGEAAERLRVSSRRLEIQLAAAREARARLRRTFWFVPGT
ncbi:MAG: hypothetical protein ACRC50_02395 [Gaiella sp.]